MEKTILRKKALELRKTLNAGAASLKIVEKIQKNNSFLNSKNVLLFYPLKTEIDLLSLLKNEDKNFYLPRVKGLELEICKFSKNLKKSSFGVLEPVGEAISDISIIDLAFIPCLAIDKKLNRLGYGCGFYDRLFSNDKFRATKIAVLYKELVVDEILTDEFDKKVDCLITD